jgi:hypothetical protein
MISDEVRLIGAYAFQAMCQSYERCKDIDVDSIQELNNEHLEAYTARFARFSDIYFQKLLRAILNYLAEDERSFLDRMNNSEKLGIITSAETMRKIRMVRNDIAHEYMEEKVIKLWKLSLFLFDDLIKSYQTTRKYLSNKKLLEE